MNFCEVLLNMINYGYQGVDTASYRLLRFGEKLVQIWCSEDLEPGHNKSLVQWIQDRGLCMAQVQELFLRVYTIFHRANIKCYEYFTYTRLRFVCSRSGGNPTQYSRYKEKIMVPARYQICSRNQNLKSRFPRLIFHSLFALQPRQLALLNVTESIP